MTMCCCGFAWSRLAAGFFMRQERQCAGAPGATPAAFDFAPYLGAVHKVGLAQWAAGGVCRLDVSLREC